MDNRDSSCNESTGALIQKLECGELTFDVLCQRLRAVIDAELRKPCADVDQAYLDSCQNLLDSLTLSEKYESKQPQYERELMRHLEKSNKTGTIHKRAFAAVFVAVAMIMLFIVGDGIFYREWLEGGSSQDKQQYEIAGRVIDPKLVETGKATNMVGSSEIQTNSVDEVKSALGFSPLLPTWYPEGWILDNYYAAENENMLWFSAIFSSAYHEKLLAYTISVYSDIKEAQNAFEQSDKGKLHLVNGWNVYITMNIDDPIAVWLDGNCCNALYGHLSEEELVKVIESISKGE